MQFVAYTELHPEEVDVRKAVGGRIQTVCWLPGNAFDQLSCLIAVSELDLIREINSRRGDRSLDLSHVLFNVWPADRRALRTGSLSSVLFTRSSLIPS